MHLQNMKLTYCIFDNRATHNWWLMLANFVLSKNKQIVFFVRALSNCVNICFCYSHKQAISVRWIPFTIRINVVDFLLYTNRPPPYLYSTFAHLLPVVHRWYNSIQVWLVLLIQIHIAQAIYHVYSTPWWWCDVWFSVGQQHRVTQSRRRDAKQFEKQDKLATYNVITLCTSPSNIIIR